jgi:hypothetical protein
MAALDDRMSMVIAAYYQAVAAGDFDLATALAAAIDAGDIEAGLAAINEEEGSDEPK